MRVVPSWSPGPPGSVDVAFVTVQYNNFQDTLALAKSLATLDATGACALIVVDNSTEPDALDVNALSRALPFPLGILRAPGNLYYWGGAQLALSSLKDAGGSWPTWIVVCNNDITIEDTRFLIDLRALDPIKHPIVGPAIRTLPGGRQQNPMFRAPPPASKRLKWWIYDLDYRIAKSMLGIHEIFKSVLSSVRSAESPEDSHSPPEKIYAPHGSCVIFSSTFFDRGGTLDTSVPMFAEELTVAANARRDGVAVWFCPQLKVLHQEHSTTGHSLTREKYEMERRARKHYYGLERQ